MDTLSKFGSYKIDQANFLIIEYYSGEINENDLIHLKNEIKEQSGYNFYYKTVIDFRDAKLCLNNDSLVKLYDFFKKSYQKDNIRNIAYLTSSPNEVVLTTLFQLMLKGKDSLNFNTEIFSTPERAVSWLNFGDGTRINIEKVLLDLKTSFNNVYL